ncbi:hypothetical protein M3Y99_00156100 [Aphelenchoides fujianensis]|nr:hypothetical protein M3Y99_00156100 [Aphelenchoides fujianensis]
MRPLPTILVVLLLKVRPSSAGRFLFDPQETKFDSCSAIGWNRDFGEYAPEMRVEGTMAGSTSASTSATSENPEVEEAPRMSSAAKSLIAGWILALAGAVGYL